MQETLYERLQDAENVNMSLMQARGRYIQAMIAFEDAPGIAAVAKTLLPGPLPEISVPDYQRKIIESSTANPILLNALKGKQTVTQKLEELVERYPPKKRFFPRRENLQHDQEVEELEELVSYVGSLKTEGVRDCDNALFGVGFVTAITYGITLPLVGALHFADSGSEASQQELETMQYVLLIYLPAVMALFGGVMGYSLSDNSSSIKTAKQQAVYIDKKITELYPHKTSVVVPAEKQIIVEDL